MSYHDPPHTNRNALRGYRFDWPRTIFFTLRFFEPRAYSRGFSGFSALLFLRDARLDFLRSSLFRVFVFAMNVIAFLFCYGSFQRSITP